MKEYAEVGLSPNDAEHAPNRSGWGGRGMQNAAAFSMSHHREICKTVKASISGCIYRNDEWFLKVAGCQVFF